MTKELKHLRALGAQNSSVTDVLSLKDEFHLTFKQTWLLSLVAIEVAHSHFC